MYLIRRSIPTKVQVSEVQKKDVSHREVYDQVRIIWSSRFRKGVSQTLRKASAACVYLYASLHGHESAQL
jgi:hypothetical protein